MERLAKKRKSIYTYLNSAMTFFLVGPFVIEVQGGDLDTILLHESPIDGAPFQLSTLQFR